MKLKDVPQDKDPTYEGKTKLCYAQDENGHFIGVKTTGWKVEEAVKGYAWEIINSDLKKTLLEVQSGRASPLLYFMKLRQMEPKLLAQNMGIWTWRVRWHLRPKVFKKLSDHWLQKYADCLEIPIAKLKNFKGETDVN